MSLFHINDAPEAPTAESGSSIASEKDFFIGDYGENGRRVLQSFSSVNPQHIRNKYDVEIAYIRHAREFMRNLKKRSVSSLTNKEILELVESTFKPSQIKETAFREDIKRIADAIESAFSHQA